MVRFGNWTETPLHIWQHWITSPLPIWTPNGGTEWTGKASSSTMDVERKLCVDPLSSKITTCLGPILSFNFMVVPAVFPRIAWSEILATPSGPSSSLSLFSVTTFPASSTSSNSKREKLDCLHWCLGENFSLQQKQSPLARWFCIYVSHVCPGFAGTAVSSNFWALELDEAYKGLSRTLKLLKDWLRFCGLDHGSWVVLELRLQS